MRTAAYKLFHDPAFLFAELCYLIGLPLILIYFFPALVHLRFAVLFLGLAYVLFVSKLLGLSKHDFGFVKTNFWPSFRGLIAPTIMIIVAIIDIYFIYPDWLRTFALIKESDGFASYVPLIFYVVVSVPLQETLFRAFLIPRLNKVSGNPYFLVLISAIIFGLVHVVLGNIYLTLGACFLGLVWGHNFVKYRNIYAVMLAHSLSGAAFIYSQQLLK